ncbi:MAG: LUD domain-containing protein, partial [Armatimonadetes bacterium]|nr:LUD domain-containing protein [Armatimonadota bacterium]
ISLLPPVHIALVRAGDLLPRLDDLFAALGREPLGSGTVFISGPSGTGDIGLQHVTGVHGPREVHLVVVDEAVGSAGPPGA